MYLSPESQQAAMVAGPDLSNPPPGVMGAHNPTGPCMGCGTPIFDRHFLAVADRSWHIDCLQCCICMVRLERQLTCYVKDGMVFCRDDYYRQFSKRCSRCRHPIGAKDLVMRARDCVYHIQCFTCIICTSALQPGEYFALGDNGSLYCQAHYEPLLAMSAAEDTQRQGSMAPCTQGSINTSTSGGVQKGRPKKRKTGRLGAGSTLGFGPLGHSMGSCMVASSGDPSLMGHNSPNGRTKRMRTSFKHHQLRSMKAYFALNHNPDAKDLKQLAQKTGLTKRVLQVWFQNARAKYRRATTQIRAQSVGSESLNPSSPKSIPETSSEHNTSFSDTNGGAGRPSREEGSQSATPGLLSGPISSEGESLGSPEQETGARGVEIHQFPSDLTDDSASRTLAEYFESEKGLL